jgi:hypothetical protein
LSKFKNNCLPIAFAASSLWLEMSAAPEANRPCGELISIGLELKSSLN